MKKILPPDVSDKQFNQALAAFREVVGDNWVFADDTDELVSYRDPYAIVDEALFSPFGIHSARRRSGNPRQF